MSIDSRFFSQAQEYINESIRQEIPNANTDSGSGINAVLGRGGATITAPLLQEIEHVNTTRDLSDTDNLSTNDMDLILSNLLVERVPGDLSRGFVRIYYTERKTREFAAGLTATIESRELNFVTLAELIFEPQDHFIDSENGYYYINVPFVSEEAGEEYDVDPEDINQLVNDTSGAILVKNVSAFVNGRAEQTNEQALRTAQQSVSTRVPLSTNGAVYWMQQQFGTKLRDLLIVGLGEEEMLRDELYDLGEGQEPRFQIGVDSLDPVTREQLGSPQNLHVGGRTDLYLLFESVNYVQQSIDIFADMTLTQEINSGANNEVRAEFVEGTTGTVSTDGKLILDLGADNEETVSYSSFTISGGVYIFTGLSPLPSNTHLTGASVKVVNNSELSVGEDADISILPVFKIAEVRILDPLTFEPIGEPLDETSADSRLPGWYVTKSNVYDILSARETKTLVIDEKKDYPGNEAKSGTGASTADTVVGSVTYTQLTSVGEDFTGYQGREVSLGGSVADTTRTVLQVIDNENVILSGTALGSNTGVEYEIDAAYAEYNQYPVRVSYYTNTEIAEAQDLLDQSSDRIISGDSQARMFWPIFIDFTMYYRGDGEPEDVRANIQEVLKTSAGEAIGDSTGAKFEYSDLINAAYVDGQANYVQTPMQVRIRRLQGDGSFLTQYINPDTNTFNSLAVKSDPGAVAYADDGSYLENQDTFVSSGGNFVPGDVGRRIWIEDVGLRTITAYGSPTSVTVDQNFTSTESTVDWSFPVFFIETTRPSSVEEFDVPTEGRLFLGGFSDNQEEVEYDSFSQDGSDYVFVLKDGESINLPHPANESIKISVSSYDPDNVITDGVITDERTYRPFLGQVVIEQLEDT